MRNFLTLCAALLLLQPLSAETLYEQLCQFNPNWKSYADRAPQGDAVPLTSNAHYVQVHLTHVLQILRDNPTNHLSLAQHAARNKHLRLLDQYCQAGRFPVNYYSEVQTPVFIDEHHTHCAIGYLLQQTGHEALAKRIAAADNYVWARSLDCPAVAEWQQQSGFTMEELKLIQGVYDFYQPNALHLPNKYEVPQKPEVMTRYFDGQEKQESSIWLRGEGTGKVLHGRWEQRAAAGVPWIEGYFNHGKRSGQWKEYFQGTEKLCRTEVWRNDQLNGWRRRYDRAGKLIEEILFKNGKAVVKKNHELAIGLTYVRLPLDTQSVYTEVFTLNGELLATGKELIHNPGNLQWFQNIELTALNTAAISARDVGAFGTDAPVLIQGRRRRFLSNGPKLHFLGNGSPNNNVVNIGGGYGNGLYNMPPLVQYKKVGRWTYYHEYGIAFEQRPHWGSMKKSIRQDYQHFADRLLADIHALDDEYIPAGYDSIVVEYANDAALHFIGYGDKVYTHFGMRYADDRLPLRLVVRNIPVQLRGGIVEAPTKLVASAGKYNKEGARIGRWKHFNRHGTHTRTEHYHVPWPEEEDPGFHPPMVGIVEP